MNKFRSRNNKRWPFVAAVAVGLAVLAMAAGAAAQQPGWTLLRPAFNDVSQHIRYHPGFHDGHSHDGYGHGYHDSDVQHTHSASGQPMPQERNVVWTAGNYPPVYAGPDHTHDQYAPLGMDPTFYTLGMGKADYYGSDPTPYSVRDGVGVYPAPGDSIPPQQYP